MCDPKLDRLEQQQNPCLSPYNHIPPTTSPLVRRGKSFKLTSPRCPREMSATIVPPYRHNLKSPKSQNHKSHSHALSEHPHAESCFDLADAKLSFEAFQTLPRLVGWREYINRFPGERRSPSSLARMCGQITHNSSPYDSLQHTDTTLSQLSLFLLFPNAAVTFFFFFFHNHWPKRSLSNRPSCHHQGV